MEHDEGLTVEVDNNDSDDDELAQMHRVALERFDAAESLVREERKQSVEDRRFYSIAGAAWEGSIGDQFANTAKLEVNKIHLSIIRIFSEFRANRVTVDFVSKDGAASDPLADLCDGLYRADEADSDAEEALDNGFEESVGGGLGAWRFCTEYEDDEDDENEKQRIKIRPIYDADSCVFFDPNAKRQDKSDAKYAFILTGYTRDAYVAEFGEDPVPFNKSIYGVDFEWESSDATFVAEYYFLEKKTRRVEIWRHVDGTEERVANMTAEKRADMLAVGSKRVREKRVKVQRCRKLILSGARVLEDCGHIAGPNIPIVITYGKRWYVDGVERCMGHVRLAKDAARLGNMLRTKLADFAAQSSVPKPIFTPEQMAGHADLWANDPVKRYPYLLINPIVDANGNKVAAPPLGYTKPPELPPALAALLEITEQDLRDLLGNQQAGEQVRSNIGEQVVELVQSRLDMQTFIYSSNFRKAVRRSGQIWLGMARELYVEDGRKMKTLSLDGTSGTVVLNEPQLTDGVAEPANDLDNAKFDVIADVGPSSHTKRQSVVRNLVNMISVTEDPETKQILTATALAHMEGEGLEGLREYFRKKLIGLGVLKPTKEEQAEAAAAQGKAPDPNSVYLMASAEAEQARAAKARADTVRAIADAEKLKAETAEIVAQLDRGDLQAALAALKQLASVAGVPLASDSGTAGPNINPGATTE